MNCLINRLSELDEYGYKAQTGMSGHEAVAEIEKLEAQNAMMQASRSQRIEELERERDCALNRERQMRKTLNELLAGLKAQVGEPCPLCHAREVLVTTEIVGRQIDDLLNPTTERRVEEQALQIAIVALNRLANLGNGDVRGNSIGNDIAAEAIDRIDALNAAPAKGGGSMKEVFVRPRDVYAKFQLGDTVRKTKGSQWHGKVVGTYSTTLTPEGYAVESSTEIGSVQIYPAAALEDIDD